MIEGRGGMRKWTAGAFHARCEASGQEIVWLPVQPSPSNAQARSCRLATAFERAGTTMARATAYMLGGMAVTAALPGVALAPVGTAYASVDHALGVPAPALALSIPVAPIFAPSAEERKAAAAEGTRREVEDFLRFGSRDLPRRVVESIVGAADATGVDAIYLMALADKESSFRTEIKASTSSAEGLFQFIERTWLDVVRSFGARHGLEQEALAVAVVDGRPSVADEALRDRILDLRRDPYLSAVMAAELLKRDAAQLGFRFGRKLSETEMYLAHFLGLEDAARFIALRGSKRRPNAARAFPGPARANTAIFYDRGRRKRRGLSVPEVYARIQGMIDMRITRYRDVQILASAKPGL